MEPRNSVLEKRCLTLVFELHFELSWRAFVMINRASCPSCNERIGLWRIIGAPTLHVRCGACGARLRFGWLGWLVGFIAFSGGAVIAAVGAIFFATYAGPVWAVIVQGGEVVSPSAFRIGTAAAGAFAIFLTLALLLSLFLSFLLLRYGRPQVVQRRSDADSMVAEKKKRTCRRLLIGGLCLMLIYVLTYCVLSAKGSYYWRQSGKLRYNFGFSVTDMIEWDPYGTVFHRQKGIDGHYFTRTNDPGYLFAPLIYVDRAVFHKTQMLFSDEAKTR